MAAPLTTAVTQDFYNEDFIFDVQSLRNEFPALTDRAAVSWIQAKRACSNEYGDLSARMYDSTWLTVGAVGFGILVPAASAYTCLKEPTNVCHRNIGVGIALSSGLATALGQVLSSKSSQNAVLEERQQAIRRSEGNLEKELLKIRSMEPGSDTELVALGAIQTYKASCVAGAEEVQKGAKATK